MTKDKQLQILQILQQPDTFLRQPTQDIDLPISSDNEELIEKMIHTMYEHNGVGLAANQVGYNRRIFVMDISNERNKPQVFINPVVLSKNNIKMKWDEGCLSCVGHDNRVPRSVSITLEWICRHGKKQHKTFYHFPSVVVQHEMDHLDGKLIIDYPKVPLSEEGHQSSSGNKR